jgi:hypothetical protein
MSASNQTLRLGPHEHGPQSSSPLQRLSPLPPPPDLPKNNPPHGLFGHQAASHSRWPPRFYCPPLPRQEPQPTRQVPPSMALAGRIHHSPSSPSLGPLRPAGIHPIYRFSCPMGSLSVASGILLAYRPSVPHNALDRCRAVGPRHAQPPAAVWLAFVIPESHAKPSVVPVVTQLFHLLSALLMIAAPLPSP